MSVQKAVDRFYKQHGGPCCAGCDWWRFHNSAIGECTKSAPVAASERYGMLGFHSASIELEAAV